MGLDLNNLMSLHYIASHRKMMMAVDLDSPQIKYLKLHVPLYIEPSMIMKQTFLKQRVV